MECTSIDAPASARTAAVHPNHSSSMMAADRRNLGWRLESCIAAAVQAIIGLSPSDRAGRPVDFGSMATFAYIARDTAGQKVEGKLAAATAQSVLNELQARQLAPVQVREVREKA